MPLGYVIAQVTVTDPEAFEKYRIRRSWLWTSR